MKNKQLRPISISMQYQYIMYPRQSITSCAREKVFTAYQLPVMNRQRKDQIHNLFPAQQRILNYMFFFFLNSTHFATVYCYYVPNQAIVFTNTHLHEMNMKKVTAQTIFNIYIVPIYYIPKPVYDLLCKGKDIHCIPAMNKGRNNLII